LSLQNNSLLHFSELYSTVWTELRVLNLSKNKLTQLPANIGEYKSLEVLKASQNIIAILPDSIGNCKHLTTLCIDENAILSLPIGRGLWWMEGAAQ
jgi:Leucine-rich repeat (LRR) protein